jgi:hypothetical protein
MATLWATLFGTDAAAFDHDSTRWPPRCASTIPALHATIVPIVHPGNAPPEPRHTIAYPHGPTCASNLKALCRFHYRNMTAPGAWRE